MRLSEGYIKLFKDSSSGLAKLIVILLTVIFSAGNLYSQVISNNGASITLTNGIVVGTKDAVNSFGGFLINNGTFNMTGNYTSTATTSGNGLFTLGGNWTNTGGIFVPGTSTVIFNGAANQTITRTGGEGFNNLTLANTGLAPLNRVIIANNVSVSGTLTMSVGNISSGTWVLYLSNPAAAALNYTSTTKSRVIGKFERGVNEQGNTYLFPLGTDDYYNPANLKPNSILSSGSLLSEFLTLPLPGNNGLPLPDPPVEIADVFTSGYWSMTSYGFSAADFDINLASEGFTDTLRSDTRIVKRTAGGDWIVDGSHITADTIGNVAYRQSLLTDISPTGTQFALGRARPLITVQPQDTIHTCEDTNPVFSIVATGTPALKYAWYKVASPSDILLTNGPDYTGTRTPNLTILNAQLDDTGRYYCVVTDRYRNSTRTNNGVLMVYKIPVATATPDAQDHECSAVPFTDIVLGETYGVPGTTYLWTRDNPGGITSAMLTSGSVAAIGDIIAGEFYNSTDSMLKVTFTITPVGPAPTYCVGIPIYAYVIVNPVPRIVFDNLNPAICYDTSTEVVLTSPSKMTQGAITFDYTVSVTGLPGQVIGSTDPYNDLAKESKIIFPYMNESDTIQSVYYSVLPRNIVSGCPDGVIETEEVKLHPEPLRNLVISVPLTCQGGSNASLTATLSRGAKPDAIDWTGAWNYENSYSTPANTTTVTNIRTGWYYINVADVLGCEDKDSVFVSGAQLDSYLYPVPKANGYNTTCPESTDGQIGVRENLGSTGIPPFEYYIIHVEPDTVVRHGTINTINAPLEYTSNLAPGTYRLLIYDANGCVNTSYPETRLEAPEPIKTVFDPVTYSGGFNISCRGYNDGSVRLDTVYGGSGSYTYKWTTTDGLISGPDNLDHLDNLPAGTYYVTITDWLLCSAVDSITLTEPDGMVLTSSEVSESPDGDFNISCNGGSDGYIKLTIDGGSGNYQFLWTGPAGFTATTRDISGLKAGTYNCTVTDLNGCILTPGPQFTLNEPAVLAVTSVPSITPEGSHNIRCFGGTGSVDVTVSGGSTGNYFYDWSTTNGSGIKQGIEDQDSLTAGTYHLVVRDSNNCVAVHDITLTEPDELTAELAVTHITCQSPGFSNGTIDLTVVGGAGSYSYAWSNGAITQDVSGLTQGIYSVTVTDFNGCIAVVSDTVNLPPPLEYSISTSNYNGFTVSCFGSVDGTINVAMENGQPPYIYSWSGPGGFTSSDNNISGLGAGQYTLVITDANMCTAVEVFDVTQPGRMYMDISLSSSIAGGFNVNCNGDSTGTIDLVPQNSVGNVTWLWSDGSTSGARSGMPAGTLGVILTDANNCHADTLVTLRQPDSLKLVFSTRQPWCPDKPDGAVGVTVTGGVPGVDYTYKWSDNSNGQGVTNILRGEYKVIVSDLNGCTVTDSVSIEPLNETCLIIPNAISPNGDLINDVWNIGEKELYPQMEIRVFNRWGETVWRSEKGYPQPWDGRSNGKPLPIDSYHYIIDLNNGTKPLVGNITIVR